MKKLVYFFAIGAIAALSITSCSKKEDVKPKDQGIGDEEAITRYTLTLTSGTVTGTASFNDPDDSGPIVPTITGLTLKAGLTYSGTISVYDDSKTPVVFVNQEIEEESDAHRFHYIFSPSEGSGVNIVTTISDVDSNGNPLGLTYSLAVGTATGTGKLRVILRHFDETTKTDNPVDGEADIDQDFDVTVVN
ncbi:MAG: hypothetical protein ACKVTZ_17390 [Bacteroidia bacterium]